MAYTREQLIALVRNYAQRYGIRPDVAVAQIHRESADYLSDVVNGPFIGGAGERGLTQFTPGTWARFGSGPHTNAYIPEYALEAWGKYMTYLLNLFDGDYSKALTGYNGGEGHLTNPAQYGAPSAAALRYASEVLAAAGSESDSGAGSGVGAGAESKTNWLLIGAVAAIALIALGVLDD
jgi:soluble lytic murein transglycosylase-like protein